MSGRIEVAELDQLFDTLSIAAPGSGEFRVLGVPGRPTIQLALDWQGRRHVLFSIPDGYVSSADTRSAGVQSRPRTLTDDGTSRKYVDLACLETGLNRVFTSVAAEVIAADDVASKPDLVIADALTRWRDLFKRSSGSAIASATRLGLFGELLVLESLASIEVSALPLWAGPLGHRHDFTAPPGDIEVKTTTDPLGVHVQVHGLEQLTSPLEGSLYLVVVSAERVPAGGRTLADIIGALISGGVDAVGLYERLSKLGLGAADIANDDVQLRETGRRMYLVDSSTPRLTGASVEGWPVAGIEYVNYGIDLRMSTPPLSEAATQSVLLTFVSQ